MKLSSLEQILNDIVVADSQPEAQYEEQKFELDSLYSPSNRVNNNNQKVVLWRVNQRESERRRFEEEEIAQIESEPEDSSSSCQSQTSLSNCEPEECIIEEIQLDDCLEQQQDYESNVEEIKESAHHAQLEEI